MSDLNKVLEKAVADKDVPFVVAMAGDSETVTFSGTAGDMAEGQKATQDTAFRIFSMTKAVGALAAMILIERGKLSLDTPVSELLPEWDELRVLEGFDGETPILREPKTVATLRNLATHTSGLEYEFWNADVARYMKLTGLRTVLTGQKSSLMYPLTSDAGTRWGYGIGSDWLGRMVEVADGRRIDAFCREEIFDPLGMADTQFEPDELADRMATVYRRTEEGDFTPHSLSPPSNPEFYGMGHALYSTAPDYMRFLQLLLNRGSLDGERILSETSVAVMLTDQMRGLTFQPMHSVAPAVSADVDMFPGTRMTHSLAFLRNETDIEGKRAAGSQGWAGVCNTHCWIDPTRDVAAVLMTQSLPFAEPGMMRTYDAFERAVYDAL